VCPPRVVIGTASQQMKGAFATVKHVQPYNFTTVRLCVGLYKTSTTYSMCILDAVQKRMKKKKQITCKKGRLNLEGLALC